MKRLMVAVAGLVMTGIASGAAATTVIGATSIEITNASNTWLQVGEVVALDGFSLIDVAASANGGSATGSDAGGYATGHEAYRAIDGNLGGSYYVAPYIFHSATESGGYLNIAFNPHTLSSLSIYGRSDCCSNRDIYNVVIENAAGAELYSGQIRADNDAHVGTVNFDLPASPTPEPASWALMIGGFGLAGASLRRRRALTASAAA
jgi:hypothetical protein